MPPIIDDQKCSRCGRCVDACTEDVFYGSEKKKPPVATYPDECVYCNACVEACPVDGAVRLRLPFPMMLMYKPVGIPGGEGA